MPSDGIRNIEVKIEWPDDVYVDATPANAFVFTELGDMVCLALGFAPIPPSALSAEAHPDLKLSATPQQARSFLVPRSMVSTLYIELDKLMRRNPGGYGLVPGDDANFKHA
jgi:hypothetical protein